MVILDLPEPETPGDDHQFIFGDAQIYVAQVVGSGPFMVM
jgi:hypothetical protein